VISLFFRHNSSNWADWDGGKIGGAPSWLDPKEIPKNAALRCTVCARRNVENGQEKKEGTLLRFLTQIYSPADKETGNKNAFHRSLYVFCCPHAICSSAENVHESVVVLRSQLPKENEFYPIKCDPDEGESWDKHKSATWEVNLCVMCGQRASGRCPTANQWFCCKDHQRCYHVALKKRAGSEKIDLAPYIYTESELVVEEEPSEVGNRDSDDAEGKVANEMNESSIFADGEGDESDELLEQSDLNKMTGADGTGTDDQTTLEFYTRIGRADGDLKSQCLRYCRWVDIEASDDELEQSNGPLWVSSNHQPDQDGIPPCEYCGAMRKFEFQVMPQMVSFVKSKSDGGKDSGGALKLTEDGKRALLAASDIVDQAKAEGTEAELPEGFQKRQEELVDKLKATILQDDQNDEALDFGTIAIYSCTASCEGKDNIDGSLGSYRKEFAWRQKPLGLE
jgi:pre-rRNA-processing protein TSR4